MANTDTYLKTTASAKADPYLKNIVNNANYGAKSVNPQAKQVEDKLEPYGLDIGSIFRQLDINATGPYAEKNAYIMGAIKYMQGDLLQTSADKKTLNPEAKVRDAVLISSFTGRDVETDILPNFDQYAKFFAGVDTGKGVLGSFKDHFEANDIQKDINNLRLMLLDVPYNDVRRPYYEDMLAQKETAYATKTADVSTNGEFWRKVASSGNIVAQSVEQIQRSLITQMLVGGLGGLATNMLSSNVTGIEQMGNALLVGDAMKKATMASAVGYTASTMMKGEASEIAKTLMEMVDEDGNRIPLDIIKENAYSWGLISAFTEMADDFMTPIGNLKLGNKTFGETYEAIKDIIKSNPLGYAALGVASTGVQAGQEGLQGYLRQKGINQAIKESNAKGITNFPDDSLKEGASESWDIIWDEFKESFIPMGVSQLLTGAVSVGATFTTSALSQKMSITPQMNKDANAYFSSDKGRVYDLGFVDTVGADPVDHYAPKKDAEGVTEQRKASPILMTVNKQTGAYVPVYSRDRQYAEFLRSKGVTGIRGIVISDRFVSQAGNTASAMNLSSALSVIIGEDNPVMGYDGDTIIMESQDGVEAAVKGLDGLSGELLGNADAVSIEKQDDGSYKVMWETESGRQRSITVRAKNDTDAMVGTVQNENGKEQVSGNVNPVRQAPGDGFGKMFDSSIRKSESQTVEDAELDIAAKYFYQQLTGLLDEEFNDLWDNDYGALMEKLPAGVDETTIEQGARFMPLLSAVTGRTTEDILNDPTRKITLSYLGKAQKARYATGEEGYIEGKFRERRDKETGITYYEIGLSDIVNQTGTALVHELMHVARAMASEERLSGFVGLKGYTGKYGGMWRSDIHETEDGRYRLGARLYDTYAEAAALVEGNEEQFVRDFFQYLKTGEAPTEEVRTFFGALKRFLQGFSREFSDQFSPETKAAFDKLLGGELDIQPGQTIEEAVEASEATLTDDVKWEANDYSDEEGLDEFGNTMYSLADPELAEKLDKEPTKPFFRTMVLIDGKIYSPVASMEVSGSKAEGDYVKKLSQPYEMNTWYVADERPDKIHSYKTDRRAETKGRVYGKVALYKDDGTMLDSVAYNPYFHAGRLFNDQFSSAYKRPNLVTVEVRIPESELSSGYRAEYAYDSVGKHDWKAGRVSDVITSWTGERVPLYMSRYMKITRVVPDSEVAKEIKKTLNGLPIPYEVVTPSLRAELEKLGVDVVSLDDYNKKYSKGGTEQRYGKPYPNTLYSLASDKQWQTMDANTQRRIDADYDYTRNQYFGTDKWMKAPNGQPTKLTERQWVQVRTPAFKEWFGDWENDPENASKIVDENGEPKVVYHGSLNRFDTFNISSEIGYHFGTIMQAQEIQAIKFGTLGWTLDYDVEEEGLPDLYEVFLNIRNPITGVTDEGAWSGENVTTYHELLDKGYLTANQSKALDRMWEMDDLYNRTGNPERLNEYLKKSLIENGYDGVIYENRFEGARGWRNGDEWGYYYDDSYIAFNSNQIKSATDNVGTFSADNNSILFSLAPPVGSKEFHDWFDDSKVVDEQGNPLVVYHGSPIRGIDEFESRGATNNGEGLIYATNEKGVADIYAKERTANSSAYVIRFTGRSGEVYPLYMDIKHPLDFRNLSDEEIAMIKASYMKDWNRDKENADVVFNMAFKAGNHQYLKDMARSILKNLPAYGYDGIIANMLTNWDVEQDGVQYQEYGVVSPKQVKRAPQADTLYSLTPAQETRALQELDSFPEAERNRIAGNFERLNETSWHREAMKALVIRSDMRALMEGRELTEGSVLNKPEYARKFKAQIKALKNGIDGVFDYLEKASFIANPQKCVHAVNSSLLNCNPSLDCAKFCYASEGNYVYWQGILKSEMITAAIENNPFRAAEVIAKQYKATTDYMVGKALRVFDKGDFSAQYVTLINELNRKDIAVQVFSKRPEFLRQINNGINVAMLSIDKSNRYLADQNPDLAIATVYSGKIDIDFIEANAKRYEEHGGVILPVKLGTKLLSEEEIKALPQWARTKYTCPIDAGTKKLGEWNCQKCDINGTGGCFYKNTAANRKYKIYASIQDMNVEAIDEGTRQIRSILEQLGISPDSGEFRRIVENLSGIKSEKLAGIDSESERTGLQGNGEYRETGDIAGSIEANNKVVEEFAKTNDSTIVELDGVKYIEHSNGTYTQDELRSIKDSVSETLHSLRLQPELNFAGQLELDFNGNQNNVQTDKMGKGRDAGGDAGASKSDLRGLRPGVAQYFDWTRGWNGQEPSTAIDGQWDNLGYISFINTEIRSPEDLAKLYSVYRNPKLEYAHIIFTKGNTVAAHMALSTGVPNSAYAVPLGGMRYIGSYMARIGADGYFLMHNHPSGDIGFSKADKGLTDNYRANIPGFRGHIILDHNKFGFFDENMKFSERSVEGMHEASEEKLTSGFKESYIDMASSFGAIYTRSMHDPTFSIFYMDYRGKVVDIEDRTDIPTRDYLNTRMKKGFHSYAVAFTNDKDLYEEMRAAAYYAKPQYNFMYVLLVDPTDPNYIAWFGESLYFNSNVWGYVKGTKRKSGEAIIPKFQHSDDTGTLYSLSPERKAEVLKQRKREIQRAVGAGIFVSTDYLNEFRGEDWVQSELELRDWMAENPDVVALARNSDTVDEFKNKYLNKDGKKSQDEVPFGEAGLFDEDEIPFTEPEEEEKESDDVSDVWYEKIFQYAHALSSADRDRQFAAEWTATEDKTLELAKTLRSYMDAFFKPKPNSRSGGYWYTKTVWGAFKGVSQKVRMLQDGKSKRTYQRERSSSEDIREAQELIRQNPRPYRNAYMTAMMAESRASQVRSGMQTGIGEDADWMALEMIDDDIAQEMERLEAESAENTRARKLGTDYKTKYEDLRKKMRDAQRDMEKATVDLKTSVGTLRSQLETANARIAELNKTIKENEADMKSAESEYSKLIERLGGKIENLEEQNAEYREKARKAKQLQKQLDERRARVAELRSELTAANRDVRRLTSALEAKRRYIEAKKAAEYRDARLRQIKRLAEFNSDTLDASYEETMNWILGLFVRDEGDMSVRKDIDSRIAALKARIEQARFSGENVESEKQELIALRRQKMQSRMLEAPAQLALYLPEGYEVRADNRPSMWSAEELDTLLRALQLMRMDAKAMLADKQATRTAYLNAVAYKYFKQASGYDASLNEYGEMSGRELLSDIMAQPERTFGKGAEKILSYHLYKAKMQRLARLIDGNKEGVAYDWFVRKSYKCQTKELSEVNRRLSAGDAVWKNLGLKHGELAKEGFQGEKQNGTKYSLTRGQMIGVYIYSQSNLGYEKLTSMSGNGIKEEDIDVISNALTAKERAWADFMLSEMDSNYQRLSDVYYLVWNKNLGRREAYFPLVGIGPMHSEDTDFLCGENAGKDSKSYVDKGFTKEVNPNALYPLNLDATATWNKQVRRQEHFVAYGEWARDTQRLLDEGRGILGAEIKQIYGEPYFRNVQRQANHVISNYITTGTGFDTVFGKYFSARNAAALTASLSTMFKQLGSIGALFETGSDFSTIFSGEKFFRNFLLANEELNAEFGDVDNVRQFIYQNAPDIKNRKIDHEVMAYMNRVYGGAFANAVQKVTGKVMEYTTNLCDRLVVERLWLAKYYTEFENLKEQGWTVSKAHDEAVFRASQLISETQPTSMRMDQSGMQIEAQKSSILRMISVFTNQAMNIENMVMFDIPQALRKGPTGKRNWKKAAQVAAAVAVNVGFVALVSGRFVKKGDEDDEKYRMRLVREIIATAASVADPVFGGNVASGLLYGSNGQDYLSEFNDIGNAIRGMLTPSDRKTAWERISKAMQDIATEVVNAAGIPAGNVLKRPVQAITEKNPGYLINTTWGEIVESYR